MSPVTVSSIGRIIREQREQARISIRQLAQAAGVSTPYLDQIELGLRKPSAEILQQLARALRVSAEVLYVQAGNLQDRPEGGVQDAVLSDPELTERQKQMLIELYESFRKEAASAAEAARPGQVAGASQPAELTSTGEPAGLTSTGGPAGLTSTGGPAGLTSTGGPAGDGEPVQDGEPAGDGERADAARPAPKRQPAPNGPARNGEPARNEKSAAAGKPAADGEPGYMVPSPAASR
jgi:transcriptional regulator with XRE-family HTH domain